MLTDERYQRMLGLLGDLQTEVNETRYELAVDRDNMLTRDEMIAKLEAEGTDRG